MAVSKEIARSGSESEEIEAMNIKDYLLEQAGHDWVSLLAGWGDLLPADFTLWMVNRLGELILVFKDGSVHMMEPGRGVLSRLADSQAQFVELIDKGNRANEWLAIELVDACVARGMRLQPNQCYGFKVPPMLGGEYTVENLEPTDLEVHYSILADIHRQTKDLPEGTPVRIVVDR